MKLTFRSICYRDEEHFSYSFARGWALVYPVARLVCSARETRLRVKSVRENKIALFRARLASGKVGLPKREHNFRAWSPLIHFMDWLWRAEKRG